MIKRVFIKSGLLFASLSLCAGVSHSAGVNKLERCSTYTLNKTLSEWLVANVTQHPTVLAAKAAVEASEFQQLAAAKALYNPELALATESVDEVTTTSLGISQTIDWGDRRGANIKFASAQLRGKQSQLSLSQQQLSLSLLTALSKQHTSQALIALATQRSELMQRFVNLARQRFSHGDLTRVEVDLAKLSYAQARFSQTSAQADFMRAQQQLIALTGVALDDWPLMPTNYPEPVAAGADKEAWVQRLATMQLALATIESAQALIKQRQAQAVVQPTLALHAGKEESDHIVGLTLSLPLPLRNDFSAEVGAANAVLIQAKREAHAQFRELSSRYEISLGSYRLSRDAWLFWQQFAADSLAEHIRLLERLWQAGELSSSDYVIQLGQALQTKASAIQQRGKLWLDWAQWQHASGHIEQCLLKDIEGAK